MPNTNEDLALPSYTHPSSPINYKTQTLSKHDFTNENVIKNRKLLQLVEIVLDPVSLMFTQIGSIIGIFLSYFIASTSMVCKIQFFYSFIVLIILI